MTESENAKKPEGIRKEKPHVKKVPVKVQHLMSLLDHMEASHRASLDASRLNC